MQESATPTRAAALGDAICGGETVAFRSTAACWTRRCRRNSFTPGTALCLSRVAAFGIARGARRSTL
eukprot:2977870-Lingulodinium_polyedra.AAC.1